MPLGLPVLTPVHTGQKWSHLSQKRPTGTIPSDSTQILGFTTAGLIGAGPVVVSLIL